MMEKHKSISPVFIVKPEVATAHMVEGAQALDVKDGSVSVIGRGDEPAPEKENASKSAVLDTIVIEKIKDAPDPPSPSPAIFYRHPASRRPEPHGHCRTSVGR